MSTVDVRNAASTAAARREQQQPSIAQFVTQLRGEIQRALPRHMNGDRVARIALTAVRKTPELANCSQASFAGALLTAAQMGLEPGTEEAYLVPYKGECTLIVGYQGWAKLFFQSPMAKHLSAHAVYANDDFDYEYGLTPYLRHKPTTGERGDVVYYYAAASLTTGASAFVVLTPDEVRALRGGKEGPSGRIPDPMKWMERKTAIRQLVKLLPRSAELNQAMVVDEAPGSEMHATLVAQQEAVAELEGVDVETGEIA